MDELAGRYVTLCLRLARLEPALVSAYTGPQRLIAAVTEEAPRDPATLARDADRLAVDVAAEPTLPDDRADWLTRQLVALGTVARHLAGERLGFGAQLARLLGTDWIPPDRTVFDKARRHLDELLPGSGEIPARLARSAATTAVPPHAAPALVEAANAAVRPAAVERYRLPRDTVLSVVPGGSSEPPAMALPAMYRYLGDHRGRIELAMTEPVPVVDLLEAALTLGWPGRHPERTLREALLVEEFGRGELTVITAPSPESVVSAGIAAHGGSVLLDAGARQALLGALLERSDIRADAGELLAVAGARPPVAAALGVVALHRHVDGWAETDCVDLLARLSLRPPAWCALAVQRLSDRWVAAATVAHAAGERLVGDHLDAQPDAAAAFRQLLTSQPTPGGLGGA